MEIGKARILARGRGKSFVKNSIVRDVEGGKQLEIFGQSEPCMLGQTINEDGSPGFPILFYPDGSGYVAIEFERLDENGAWEQVDLVTLAWTGNVVPLCADGTRN